MSAGLPFKLGRCSNGEFVPPPASPVATEAMRRAREMSDVNARRLGVSRRQFLTSAAGMAAGLVALQACSDEQRAARPSTDPSTTLRPTPPGTSAPPASTTTLGAGGTLTVPAEATLGADSVSAGSTNSSEAVGASRISASIDASGPPSERRCDARTKGWGAGTRTPDPRTKTWCVASYTTPQRTCDVHHDARGHASGVDGS